MSRGRAPEPSLLDLQADEAAALLGEHFAARGQPRYRVAQAGAWLHERDAATFEEMTDLPAAERAALARAIVGLADTLRLQTVAEGVEMAEQRAALIELGCPLGQGHYFSRAMPAEGIERLLAGRRSLVPPHPHAGAAQKLAVPRDAS